MTDTGTGPTERSPTQPKEAGSPNIGFASVKTYPRPLAAFIIASVAIKGGTFKTDTNNPLMLPQIPPTTTDAATITHKLSPMPASGNSLMQAAAAIPASAATEPTDKSIPSERITNVMPVAINALIAI